MSDPVHGSPGADRRSASTASCAQRGNRREPIFFEDGDHEVDRDLLGGAVPASRNGWNCVHLILTPKHADRLGDAVGEAQRRYHPLSSFRYATVGMTRLFGGSKGKRERGGVAPPSFNGVSGDEFRQAAIRLYDSFRSGCRTVLHLLCFSPSAVLLRLRSK